MVTLSFSVFSLVLWLLWLIVVLVNVSLVVGSFREMEPRAGVFFSIGTVIIAIVGVVIVRYLTGS